MMGKNPFIVVSICAVVLLVLGSLTNVVGYQSVKSTVTDSPLFRMRTQRANNQQQNSITSQYLGMGNGNIVCFPIRDSKTELLKKAIELISKMDDTTYKRLIEECIQKIRQDNTLRNSDLNNFTQIALFHPTCNDMTSGNWYPGCFFYAILLSMYYLIDFIFFIIIYRLPHPNLYQDFFDLNLF